MSLEISRDMTGNVTVRDPATGRSEVVATGVAGRPVRTAVGKDDGLPSHSWGQIPSHSCCGRLA